MEQQQPQQQVFTFEPLTGAEVEAIMNGLNELPSKASRPLMNKLEQQIIQQLQPPMPQAPTPPDAGNKELNKDEKTEK